MEVAKADSECPLYTKINKENADSYSNLTFTNQTLHVIGAENIVFTKDTSGEELEYGDYEIELQDTYFEMFIER